MKTTRSQHLPSGRRGSLLIVALLLAAIVAIALSSYLRLATNASKLAFRSVYAGVAMNSAEAGLEQAMWAINKYKNGTTTVWSDWDTTSGSTARKTFDLGTVDGGGRATVKVYINDRTLAGSAPFALARGIVTPVKGSTVEKWIKISLKQRSRFSNGLVAKRSITFSGNNPSVDSYNSTLGAYNATLSDGTSNRYARGSAGSASVAIDSLSVGNADIFGFVSIGTADYSGLTVGPQGKVTGNFSAANGTIDYTHISTSFTANFDVENTPSTSATYLGAITAAKTLPANTTTDRKVTASDGTVTYYYTADSISLNGDALTISPGYNVVLVVNGAVSIGGNNGALKVTSTKNTDTGASATSSLNLYISGNLDITGQGSAQNVVETTATTTTTTTSKVKGVTTTTTTTSTGTTTSDGNPKNLMIWGTNSSSQTIKIAGNGSLSAVVYAPNAAIEATGGGNSGYISGSFVGDTIKITGNDSFHYDESLKSLDSGEPLGISQWDEYVTMTDRASLGNIMDF